MKKILNLLTFSVIALGISGTVFADDTVTCSFQLQPSNSSHTILCIGKSGNKLAGEYLPDNGHVIPSNTTVSGAVIVYSPSFKFFQKYTKIQLEWYLQQISGSKNWEMDICTLDIDHSENPYSCVIHPSERSMSIIFTSGQLNNFLYGTHYIGMVYFPVIS